MKCCLCNKEIDTIRNWTQGHNAMPIKKGRCCTHCNDTKVLPTRFNQIHEAFNYLKTGQRS